MNDSYLTIESASTCEIKVERSRFIGTVIPAASRAEAEHEYDLIRKKFHDATHNCFAYQIGLDAKTEFRYSDDGEPSGTAGRSIYDAILSHKLTHIIVVVTRYFGGVKLGTGGLARAYRQTADQALSEAKALEKLIMQPFQITFEHDFTSVVMKALVDFDLRPLETVYAESVTLHSAIRMSRFAEFEAALRDRSHGRVSVQVEGEPNA
ncbi:MAG: YigZ family protein [Candidatus Zixiibacteriota bacterium]